jgi:predicted ferric reductase
MKQILWRAGYWSVAYLLVVIVPLALAIFRGDLDRRGFGTELGVGLGIVGLMMLGVQFITTARFRWVAPFFGSDSLIYFHRQAGILALFVVLAHPLVLFVVNPEYLLYLDPRENLPRAAFLSLATLALVFLVVLPLWGLRWGLSYEWWRLTHGLLAAGVLLVGLAHMLQVGHYTSGFAAQAISVAIVGGFLWFLFQARVVRPWKMRKRPYRVRDVLPDQGDVTRLIIEPLGHEGFAFEAGQYAWMTIGHSPFSLQQHPFSFASSPEKRDELEFAIKESGDFTGAVQGVLRGTQVFLEGPYGSFRLDDRAEAAVFLSGGIGVTPALSMLRAARDRGDQRPFILMYGNTTEDAIAYRSELEELAEQPNVDLVHVLSEADESWSGETGFITDELLDRHLTKVVGKDTQYFVCGPPPMMDAVEKALVKRGVPLNRIMAERFDFI